MVPAALMGALPVFEATSPAAADCLVRPSVLAAPVPVCVVVVPEHRY
jgi:hypothetical protein